MKNKWYPLNNNRFIVNFGGREIGFTKISGVELTNQYAATDDILRASRKDLKHEVIRGYIDSNDEEPGSGSSKTKASSRRNMVTLEKALKPIMTDADQSFLLGLIDKNVLIECISVTILRNDGSHAATLNFNNCTLHSFKLSDLDASSTGYIKQTLEFQYREVKLTVN